MPNNWTVAITHYDINTTTETVITENFVSLPKATDTGTEEINSATLVLSAPEGRFITTGPIIDEFDRIRISIVDSGTNEYNKVFDVIKITPSWTKSEGVRLTLFLQGMEHHLQKINYIKPHFYEGAKEVVDDIANSYNNSRGTIQPTLVNVANALPTANFAKNNYDYAVNQDTCHNRMVTTVDKLGGSVSTGGALDFYEIRFTNSAANFTTLALNVFSSGSPTEGSEVTISESTSVNVSESESGIDSQTGSVIHLWGAVDSGSLPIQFSQFKSGQRRFNLYPLWDAAVTYPVDSIVQNGSTVYICILESTNNVPPNVTYWTVRTANTDFGSIVYSPWTDGAANAWKDGGIDPTDGDSSGEIGQGFFDGNIIVNDTQEDWFRTVADVRVSAANPEPSDITTSLTLQKYLYNLTHFYRGFRVLLQSNTAGGGTWAGNDTNGVAFQQAIVECTSPGTAATAVWRVVYAATTDDLVCTVRDEGIVYSYDTTGNTWTAGAMNTEGDHLHPYTSLSNAQGVPNAGDGTYANNIDTAILATYEYTVIPGPPLLGIGRTATENHMIGAWLNFTYPFPAATINGGGGVGSIYGGSYLAGDTVCEPATFDTQNMHLTHDGFRGFNVGIASEDFGQISSLDFWMKLDYRSKLAAYATWDTDGSQEVEAANFIMTCFLVDTEDNVVSQDFTLSFNNQWDEYKLPIGGFKIYRGRKPADSIFTTIIPPKELEISNIFRWRNIKHIIIQTKESYDAEGRYRTSSLVDNRYKQVPTLAGVPLLFNTDRRIDLYIDALHWTKPLLVNTGADVTRCLEGEFLERPEIADYYQLKNDANAELEKRQFRHVEFDITTTGQADINFGDYFLYENSNLIADEFEVSGGSNTIKMVAKHIEYSITKPVNGKGGYLRRILGVRRFT